MKKVVLPLLFFAASCGARSHSDIMFVDRVGHSALIFDNNIKKYSYVTVGSNENPDKIIENCSSSDFICIDGPFYLKMPRVNEQSMTVFESNDGEKACRFTFDGSDDDLKIKSFICTYANGAPSPEYRAVRVSDSGQMSAAALPVKAIISQK